MVYVSLLLQLIYILAFAAGDVTDLFVAELENSFTKMPTLRHADKCAYL